MSNRAKYTEIFDYLSAPSLPTEAHPTVVFGRQDPRVAHKAGKLAAANLSQVIAITGGIGKDSGSLREEGFDSEAGYLEQVLSDYAEDESITLPRILIDKKARHGGENAEFSLRA